MITAIATNWHALGVLTIVRADLPTNHAERTTPAATTRKALGRLDFRQTVLLASLREP